MLVCQSEEIYFMYDVTGNHENSFRLQIIEKDPGASRRAR